MDDRLIDALESVGLPSVRLNTDDEHLRIHAQVCSTLRHYVAGLSVSLCFIRGQNEFAHIWDKVISIFEFNDFSDFFSEVALPEIGDKNMLSSTAIGLHGAGAKRVDALVNGPKVGLKALSGKCVTTAIPSADVGMQAVEANAPEPDLKTFAGNSAGTTPSTSSDSLHATEANNAEVWASLPYLNRKAVAHLQMHRTMVGVFPLTSFNLYVM